MAENLIFDKIKNYTITDSILDLIRNLNAFCEDENEESHRNKQKSKLAHRERDKSNLSVQFRLKKNSIEHTNIKAFMDKIDDMVQETDQDGASFPNDEERNEDYLEILRLRHLNLNRLVVSPIASYDDVDFYLSVYFFKCYFISWLFSS